MTNVPVMLLTAENSFGARATKAGIVSLQGMLTIFLVLAILWGMIELMHRVIAGKAKPKKVEPTAKAAPAEPAPTVDAAPAAEDTGALIAAITAAIIAARAEEGNTTAFRVVSFRRSGASRTGRGV